MTISMCSFLMGFHSQQSLSIDSLFVVLGHIIIHFETPADFNSIYPKFTSTPAYIFMYKDSSYIKNYPACKEVCSSGLILYILQEVGDWMKSCKSSKLSQAVNNLKKELKKLDPPSSVVHPAKSASAVPTTKKTLTKAGSSSSVESAV